MDMDKDGLTGRIEIADIIKAAACLMIFLYHCNTILPGEWKFVTIFGQNLGNNLFFMVSGFVLASSMDRASWRDFPKWYLKRLVRILPITIIAYIAAYLVGYYSFSDPVQLIVVFIYPTLYWFITCILIFYILVFTISKLTGFRIQGAICILLATGYVVLAGRQERLYVIGLLSMLMGYMAKRALDQGMWVKLRKSLPFVLVVAFILFMVSDVVEVREGSSYLISALLCISSQAIGVSALALGYLSNEKLNGLLSRHKVLQGFVRYVGDMALPLYIVQCFCSGYIGFWIGMHIDFPISFFVNFVISWGLGTVLYFISKWLQHIVRMPQ